MSTTTPEDEQLSLFPPEQYKGEDGKVCIKCNEYKHFSEFSNDSGGNYLRSTCRKCAREHAAVTKRLRDIHGLPPEGYQCPVCERVAEEVKQHNGSWVVDHCHVTNKFRGWLCHNCNRALGCFSDNIGRLKRAIDYLEESK